MCETALFIVHELLMLQKQYWPDMSARLIINLKLITSDLTNEMSLTLTKINTKQSVWLYLLLTLNVILFVLLFFERQNQCCVLHRKMYSPDKIWPSIPCLCLWHKYIGTWSRNWTPFRSTCVPPWVLVVLVGVRFVQSLVVLCSVL